jgi:hypothetical protein
MIGTYQRPNTTYQDRLTNQDIKELLKDYIIVENIKEIPLGTHIRYFLIDPDTKKRKFRTGGTISKIDLQGRFIKLTAGTVTWSVQILNTLFYKKLNEEEYKEELKKEILTEINPNNDYKQKIKLLTNKINILTEENNLLRKNNKKLIKQIQKIQIEIEKKK